MASALKDGPIDDLGSIVPLRYSDAEIEIALAALARNSGNAKRTERELRGSDAFPDRSPSDDTLAHWVKSFPERYERIRQEVLPKVRDELAEAHTRLATRQVELAADFAEQVYEKRDDLAPHQIAAVMAKMDIGSGIHTQKAQELRGEATTVIEHRSLSAAVNSLKARGFEVEFVEAEVIEPEQIEEDAGS